MMPCLAVYSSFETSTFIYVYSLHGIVCHEHRMFISATAGTQHLAFPVFVGSDVQFSESVSCQLLTKTTPIFILYSVRPPCRVLTRQDAE